MLHLWTCEGAVVFGIASMTLLTSVVGDVVKGVVTRHVAVYSTITAVLGRRKV